MRISATIRAPRKKFGCNEMPRKLPPFVQVERSRHGKIVFYFRRGKGKRTRLPEINSDDFDPAYQRVIAGAEPRRRAKATAGSLEWLIDRYRETMTYRSLSAATRKQRDNIFRGILEQSGCVAYRKIARKHIVQGREDRRDTPAQARNFLDATRGLFRWAHEAELVLTDPTVGVKNPKRPKSGGFPVWTDDEVATYEARWPEGSKERVWLHVLLYTGLRRGDAVVIGKQHVRDGIMSISTEKTGITVHRRMPITLVETLRAGPTSDLIWICGERGQPLTKESFGNFFRAACRAAGIKKSAHGLRKLAATKAAEDGLSVAELEALFGWTGGTMASHYTKSADRKRLAIRAAGKMENTQFPHLSSASPHPKKKGL